MPLMNSFASVEEKLCEKLKEIARRGNSSDRSSESRSPGVSSGPSDADSTPVNEKSQQVAEILGIHNKPFL